MSDLIERLRHFSGDPAYGILSNARAAMVEAAARIEALEAALREADSGLEAIIRHYASVTASGARVAAGEQYPWVAAAMMAQAKVRAALPHP